MRLITLVRHAKADPPESTQQDFDRQLSSAGVRDAARMSGTIARELERPVRLYASPAARTMATARAFAAALGIDEASIIEVPSIYEATAGSLLSIVQDIPDACVHPLIFGHNPGISDFARILAVCPFIDMPPCGIATLRVATRRWKELAPNCGGLLRFRHPESD